MTAWPRWLNRIDWPAATNGLQRLADPRLLPIAIEVALVLAALVVSFVAIARATQMDRALREQVRDLAKEFDGAMAQMRARLDGLGEQIEEVRRVALQVPTAPRAGFNLSKRSEALRMYRRGEPPARIATALDIAPQEVDLLLKVHRIVIKNL